MRWQPRTLATGLEFPEGPVWLGPDDVVLVETRAQRVTRCSRAGTHVVASTGGGPNGAALGADGGIYVANNGGLCLGPGGYWMAGEQIAGRIQRVGLDSEVTDVAVLGSPPSRPNDACFAPDGSLMVTDPRNWEDLANVLMGRLWRIDSAGPAVLAEVPSFPNGIAFGPGGGVLYVAQSVAMTILAFDWTAGALGEPRIHCKLSRGFPDGMCVAADGRLIACGSMGHVIEIFDAAGESIEVVEAPDGSEPTNCCLGGDGALYVTLAGTGELVVFDDVAAPLPLYAGFAQ